MKLVTKVIRLTHNNLTTFSFEIKQKLEEPKLINHINMQLNIEILQADYRDIESMRELYRHEAHCQIVHDSALSRGIADPYLIHLNGRVAGYAGVWNKYYPGRIMEFYILPYVRQYALPMSRKLQAVSRATHIEAQTNMLLMLMMLHDCGINIVEEKILFEDGFTTKLNCPAARCNPSNLASRLTLEKAGFLPCGRLLAGEVKNPETK